MIQLTLTLKEFVATRRQSLSTTTTTTTVVYYPGLRSPGRSCSTYLWNDSWVETFQSPYLLQESSIIVLCECPIISCCLYWDTKCSGTVMKKKSANKFPSPANTTGIVSFIAFVSHSIKTWKCWPNFFKLQSISILAIRRNSRQETVSMLKYCLKQQNWTIIFRVQLMRRHLTV